MSLYSSLQAPQCGFTDATVHLFDQLQVDYECIDCLDEERNPGLREVSGREGFGIDAVCWNACMHTGVYPAVGTAVTARERAHSRLLWS